MLSFKAQLWKTCKDYNKICSLIYIFILFNKMTLFLPNRNPVSGIYLQKNQCFQTSNIAEKTFVFTFKTQH